MEVPGLSFVWSGISWGKVKTYKIPGIFSKKNRRLVPAKFVYVLVRMRYFLAVKYKHNLWGKSFSAWENSTQCLTLAVQWNVKIELKYLKAFVNDLKDKKSQHKVFCKKSVRQKAFLKFAAVLCICGKNPWEITFKRSQF